ncbi:asparagine synthase (glutamine-hydrolyzing) [Butyrivibrio fibrisolvens]|uniref:asparagine synthase (glutamine-hydrolyzing) n=1 Tax=Pseudobutyrivibrio ruminis TaxID=46206 RepID=UPI00040DE081|nr:asparagine synthase (glutamine-hydrolyzing) [Pseudobutyrivibrio ruminis]MDC7278804.1 asparagine synthase (glutamine-hydrolyzing) [Butyrivibrio fibrisolvens]
MCGIAGFFGNDFWKNTIIKMNDRMIHRGPNAQEYWHSDDDEMTFGHVRLSILDLSDAGRQPMHSHDDRYVLVFNGEVYNNKDLKNRLINEKKCIDFRGHSDTEILLEYISAYGLKTALQDSVGMFAIALFDKDTKEVFLARDRMGEKPLYYGFVNGRFCFASDIGSISVVFRNELTIDKSALSLYFTYGYIPAPYSIYNEIGKLQAGCIARVSRPYSKAGVHIEKYWDVTEVAKRGSENPFQGSFDEAVNELDNLLHKSIERQMVADVPVGAFLSGGIDSSAVVSVMQDVSSQKVKTFSIGFDDDVYNEACFAKDTAKHLGTDHTECYISPSDAKNVIPQLSYIYSEPFADSSQIPTFLVSKLAREQVTVSLSGDGGDELFCGYNSYFTVPQLYRKLNTVPLGIRRVMAGMTGCFPDTGEKTIEGVRKLLSSDSVEDFYARIGNGNWAKELTYVTEFPPYAYNQYSKGYVEESEEKNLMLMDLLMYHTDDILVKVDRAAMAVSLESRIPLLDRDIIEFAWSLPTEYNKNGQIGKNVLRNVLYKYVPKEMMERPKKGFAVPIDHWLRFSELKEWAEDLLNEDKIRMEGILNPKVVTRTWKHFLKTGDGVTKVWYMLMFEEWVKGNY